MRIPTIHPKKRTGNRRNFIVLAVAVLLLAGGGGAIGYALTHQLAPPMPTAAVAGSTNTSAANKTAPHSLALPYSKPVSITIPAINVSSQLIEVGQNSDGSIEVPAPPHYDNAAWYKYSPAPGQAGAAVILGHIDNYKTGASVFYNLGKLKPGDRITVARSDGRSAIFQVTGVREYQKSDFPTTTVYTGDGSTPELHLITCGGSFNHETGHYEANTVVFSTMVSSQAAS